MPARQPLQIEKKVWDVNVLAIYLVEDHPGHRYVAPIVDSGLRGEYVPVILDMLPLRAYWIMERKWKIDSDEARAAVLDFIEKCEALQFTSLRKETIAEAFKLAENFDHDVYDCTYIALAKQEEASAIVTTDTDFKELCKKAGLKYENPVPEKVLKKFKSYK